MEISYHVKGPKKDYTSTATYSRWGSKVYLLVTFTCTGDALQFSLRKRYHSMDRSKNQVINLLSYYVICCWFWVGVFGRTGDVLILRGVYNQVQLCSWVHGGLLFKFLLNFAAECNQTCCSKVLNLFVASFWVFSDGSRVWILKQQFLTVIYVVFANQNCCIQKNLDTKHDDTMMAGKQSSFQWDLLNGLLVLWYVKNGSGCVWTCDENGCGSPCIRLKTISI
jgi:hypothetical protein